MSASKIDYSFEVLSEILYKKMKRINPGIQELELYEFRYALTNLAPEGGWASVKLDDKETIEKRINSRDFYTGIQQKPRVGDRLVLDENIVRLTNMLFVGLVTGEFSEKWIRAHFYFDIRGFFFLARTVYFTSSALAHFGGRPFKRFRQRQKRFERDQGIGYKDFKAANAEIDQFFIESVKKLLVAKGTPILITLAGPTAAGKTEIVERLRSALEAGSVIPPTGKKVTSIEMDNFFTDRDYRDEKGINSLGKEAYHFELFMQSVEKILQRQKITIPRYTSGVSSHDLDGNLKADGVPLEIEPADIVFIEGNFPFQLKEVAHLIGIKIVYLTDDAIRLKRKWKRDIDYRKKYDPAYFRNRFFKTQFLRAQDCYQPQMEVCDMVVDTTGAAIWATPEIAEILSAA
jgi:uridine kinase